MDSPTILIVDDEVDLAKTYKRLFCQEGWTAEAVFDGESAVKVIETTPFDVVLLDMRMPKRDGFWTLEAILKTRSQTCVVFFTAFGDVDTAVKALKKGAWSMVMKGPRFEQVFEVVRTALMQWRELQQAKENEKKTENERRLISERLDATRNLAQGVNHQLKNRLASCGFDIDIIENAADLGEAKRAGVSLRKSIDLTELCVNSLHDVWRLESENSLLFKATLVVNAANEGFKIAQRHMARSKLFVELKNSVPNDLNVLCIQDLLPQVFETLFHNSMEAIGQSEGEIELSAELQGQFASLRVSDNGPGFPSELLERAHLPFVTGKKGSGDSSPSKNFGMGLYFVKVVVERCGGSMRYFNRKPNGAVVEMTFPLEK